MTRDLTTKDRGQSQKGAQKERLRSECCEEGP